MMSRIFIVACCCILSVGILLKTLPYFTNNFYFTTDQGRDAVYVREILAGRNFPLVGPETSVAGVYHGALWYYFIALGYLLFGGHPFGAVFMLILLNAVACGVFMWSIAGKISPWWVIAVGMAITFSWGIYDASRYAFNPFPLTGITFVLIPLLSSIEKGKDKKFLWAGILSGLAFHAHIVAAIPVYIMYIVTGILFLVLRRTTFTTVLLGIFIATFFLSPHVLSEGINGFPQLTAIRSELSNPAGFFAGSDTLFPAEFFTLVGSSVVPQFPHIGFLLYTIVIIIAFFPFGKPRFLVSLPRWIKTFICLTVLLVGVTYIWYSTNSIWRSWQTVYVPPLIFVSVLLGILRFPKSVIFMLYIFFFTAQSQYLWVRLHSDKKGDAGLLATQLQVIDWIYNESGGDGFEAYIYVPSVLDYTYQYLFPWYGVARYGFLPCVYSSYPGSPKLFIPGARMYSEPAKPCTGNRFLIIEPNEKNKELQSAWLDGVRIGSNPVSFQTVGTVRVEKLHVLTDGNNTL